MPGETSQALPDYGALPGSQSPGVLLLSAVSEQVTCSSSVLGKLPTNAKATEKRKQPKVTLAPTPKAPSHREVRKTSQLSLPPQVTSGDHSLVQHSNHFLTLQGWAEMVQRRGTQTETGGTDAGKASHSFLSDLALGVDRLSVQQPGLPLVKKKKKKNPTCVSRSTLDLSWTKTP